MPSQRAMNRSLRGLRFKGISTGYKYFVPNGTSELDDQTRTYDYFIASSPLLSPDSHSIPARRLPHRRDACPLRRDTAFQSACDNAPSQSTVETRRADRATSRRDERDRR